MKARFDDSLDPRVVCGQYGWWQNNKVLGLDAADPFSNQGSSFNWVISSEATDPISGSAPLRSYVCDVQAE